MNKTELKEIREVAQICNEHDRIKLKLNFDLLQERSPEETSDFFHFVDGKLVGFLGIFQMNAHEVEITGMVHPDHRRQGIFTKLFAEAKREIERRGIAKLIFIVQRDSQAGKAFVQSLGATYDFSEYWMSLQEEKELPMTHPLQLRLAQEEELDFVGVAMAAAFDGFEKEVYVDSIAPMEKQTNSERYLILHDETPVGTLAISFPHENAAFVFGFCVLPEYQGRGYGRQALMLAVQNMRAIGRETIDLEVACENLSALGLYQSCGFQVASANDYYVLTSPSS